MGFAGERCFDCGTGTSVDSAAGGVFFTKISFNGLEGAKAEEEEAGCEEEGDDGKFERRELGHDVGKIARGEVRNKEIFLWKKTFDMWVE